MLVFGTYMIGLVSKMVEEYEFLRVLSPIEYAHPAALLASVITCRFKSVSAKQRRTAGGCIQHQAAKLEAGNV